MITITLSAEDSQVFVQAVDTAISVYREAATRLNGGLPQFGMDDQPPASTGDKPDLVLISGLLVTLGSLTDLRAAIRHPSKTSTITVDVDVDDSGRDLLTILVPSKVKQDAADNLLLLAIFNANVKTKNFDAVRLIERLEQ